MATLANGGVRVTPHLVKAVDAGKGWQPVPSPPPQSKVDVTPEKLQAIRDGMWMVVNGGGTGGRARIVGHDVCGKTGTAQVISNTGRTAARTNRATFATTAGSCSSPRATTRRLPASCSWNMAFTARTRRRSRTTFSTTYFAKRDGKPLPPAPTHDELRLDYKDPYARGATPIGGQN